MIKAIETRYAGCRFRSRLEARWAVFFDALKIEWQYEPQGFELPSGPYLPDFYLPGVGAWVEVKGKIADGSEMIKCQQLCVGSGEPVMIFEGDIPRTLPWDVMVFTTDRTDGRIMTPIIGPPDPFATKYALDAARSARFEHGERG